MPGFVPVQVAKNYLAGRQNAQDEQAGDIRNQLGQQQIQQQQTAMSEDQQRKVATRLMQAAQYGLQAPAGQAKPFIDQNFPELAQAARSAGHDWDGATDDQVRAELQGLVGKFGPQAGVGPAPPKERALINTVGPDGKPVRGVDVPGAHVYEAPKDETGPLESIIGPNGKPVLATRHDAVGKTPFAKPQAGENYDQQSVENTAQMIANNQIPMISGFALKSPWGQEVISRVREINPQFAGADYGANLTGIKQFTSGKNGNTIRSLNVAVQHLDQLGKLADALNNGDVPLFNKVAIAYQKQTGSAAPSNFDAAKKVVADEIVKAIVGSGGGVADREEAARSINSASSPEQLAGVIQTYQGLMTGQLNGIREQYKAATGRDNFESLLLPETRAKLEAHSAPPASTAPEQTATGPGGQKIALRNGQWVPVK